MRRAGVAVVLAAGLAAGLPLGEARSADLGVAAPSSAPLVPPAPRWTGFYAGVNAGAVFGQANSSFSLNGGPAFGAVSNADTGVAGGFQAGYNWQSGPLLLGVETDFQFASGSGGKTADCSAALCGVTLQASYSNSMPWAGTIRGRVGYITGPLLLYATGGYAYGRLETDASASLPFGAAVANWGETLQGWTAGGGVEFVMANTNWSMKMEYLHLAFSHSNTWLLPLGAAITDDASADTNLVRAGLNYKF